MVKNFVLPILVVLHQCNLRNTHSGSKCWVPGFDLGPLYCMQISYGAFTLDVKSVLNENLGGILGGMQC
jgi:hypothetical protein